MLVDLLINLLINTLLCRCPHFALCSCQHKLCVDLCLVWILLYTLFFRFWFWFIIFMYIAHLLFYTKIVHRMFIKFHSNQPKTRIYEWRCSSRTSRSWRITQSTYHHRRGCNNIPSFLQRTAPIARSLCEGWTPHDLHILVTAPFCCDRKSRAACAQSFALWQQATIEFTCHDHSNIACSRHIYVWYCSSRTSRSWWITQSTQHHRRGCNIIIEENPASHRYVVWKATVTPNPRFDIVGNYSPNPHQIRKIHSCKIWIWNPFKPIAATYLTKRL